jgi:(E)-2-((N-methylformamido)methylene)succinate hydrolase
MPRNVGDGTRYELSGTSGPTVVLVHGLGANRRMWQWQTDALAKHYRLVTYDLYGHGESPSPPETPSLRLFATQLCRLLDDLSVDKAAILGFSLGGMIVRSFAMAHPDRLWALGILHSPHRRDRAARDAVQARVHQARHDGPGATIEAALKRWFTDDFRNANPAIMNQVREWVLANKKDVYAQIYQVLVDGVDELVAPRPPIDCPTLVMTGDEDFGNSPDMTRAIAAEIAGSKTVILPGLRHMAMVETPEVFNTELLGFLGTVNRAAPTINRI